VTGDKRRHRSLELAGPPTQVTDLGQAQNMSPPEGMRVFIAAMLREGFRPREVEQMVKELYANPRDVAEMAAKAIKSN